MMNTTYETYMNALKQGLASFDSAAAEEILNDFESHFADARSQGLSDEEICAELGNVDDVLEFFRQEYATTEQPVANVLPQEKTHSNSEETHPNYPYDPSTAITAMEISLRNASADFAPGTSASVEFDFSGDFDPDRFEAGKSSHPSARSGSVAARSSASGQGVGIPDGTKRTPCWARTMPVRARRRKSVKAEAMPVGSLGTWVRNAGTET